MICKIKSGKLLDYSEILTITHRATRGGKSSFGVWDAIDAATGCGLTAAHTAKGLDWLRGYCFCKNGQLRQTCTLPPWAVEIVRNFDSFYFAGVYSIGFLRPCYVPVWGVRDRFGNCFEYCLSGGSVLQVG